MAAAPAHADDPEVRSVTIVPGGEPFVGVTTLTALVTVKDGPGAITYAWRRCGHGKSCVAIAGATLATYVPRQADVGQRLRVRATVTGGDDKQSDLTAVVRAAPAPVPGPAPQPSPQPAPQPAPQPSAQPAPAPVQQPSTEPQPFLPNVAAPPASTAPPPAAAPFSLAPRYLDPFPVVRIRGSIARRGANVDLLRVSAPRRATVKVRCSGSRCPVRRRTQRPGRIRKFERFLPAGLEITIRVRRQAFVGKYVRLTVLAGKAPARRDACVMPGQSQPVACPPG